MLMMMMMMMQFGITRRVSPRNMYYMGMQMPPEEGALLGMSGRLKSIVKHRILGVG